MDETKNATNSSAPGEPEAWDAPTLTVHGDFRELTRFTSGAGPDDGLFDPGAATSAA